LLIPAQAGQRQQKEFPMVEKTEPRQPTHRAYSVIRREGQDDFWLNIGLAFPHKDNKGFNVILQAIPFDGKVVIRELDDEESESQPPPKAAKPSANRAPRGRK
jgi:hypothetical protein